jgi:TRAP-type C4-dicarboxylate transport system substrate-binding protein
MSPKDEQAWLGTMKPWSGAVEQRTGGRVKFEANHAGALMSIMETPEGIAAGMADIAYFTVLFRPADFPSWIFGGIPDPTNNLTPAKDPMIGWILYDEFPSFNKELEKYQMKILMHNINVTVPFMMRMEVQGLADLVGKRLRVSTGEYHAKLWSLLGATPASIPWPEAYESLDKGIVDGSHSSLTGIRDLKFYEVVEQVFFADPADFLFPMGVGYMFVFNVDSWNQLPSDIQLIMLEEAKRQEMAFVQKVIADAPQLKAELAATGLKFSKFPPEDISKWGEVAGDLYKDAMTKLDGMGVQGSKMVPRYLELAAMSEAEVKRLYDKAWEKKFAAIK